MITKHVHPIKMVYYTNEFGETTHTHSTKLHASNWLLADNNDVTGIQKKIHLNLWFLDPIHIFVDYKTELNMKLKESQMQVMKS
jgi:hypothetical protein